MTSQPHTILVLAVPLQTCGALKLLRTALPMRAFLMKQKLKQPLWSHCLHSAAEPCATGAESRPLMTAALYWGHWPCNVCVLVCNCAALLPAPVVCM